MAEEVKKPWEQYGLTASAYYSRIRRGRPLDAKLQIRTPPRASGRKYKNPPEKIEAIKEKYKDGIPEDVLEAFASEVFSAFYE